jgi:hypothetical protein
MAAGRVVRASQAQLACAPQEGRALFAVANNSQARGRPFAPHAGKRLQQHRDVFYRVQASDKCDKPPSPRRRRRRCRRSFLQPCCCRC